MPAYNFQSRFAPKVRSGEKLQTIRRRRKRPTVEGDTLYLYTNQRTKNAEKLREAKCVRVLPIEIHDESEYIRARVKVGLDWVNAAELDDFARADGFADADEFFQFWRDVHGLTKENPLTGFELIQWKQTT